MQNKSTLWPQIVPIVWLSFVTHVFAWTPGTGSPTAAQDFLVDPTNRTDVLAFYNTIYSASENYAADMAWTGDTASGVAGTTSATFKDDVRRRINFYRALVALPADITFDATKCGNDQDAALMFSANNALSHNPPPSWKYFTLSGSAAASNSNIAFDTCGPASVDTYMHDDGANNNVAGHRRWLLYSQAQEMGTGDVAVSGTYHSANAIWILGNFKAAPTPQFVAWPNRGFAPFPLLPARWSLSYPGANFSAANVLLTQGTATISTTIISNADNGYGDNTLVWTPASLPSSINADTPYTITVSGISGTGVPTSYNYSVTLFDPNVLGNSVTISGTNSPYTTGANYTFNSIAEADSYQLQVSTGSAAAWLEGAEDSPIPQISGSTSYTLRQTAVKRTGSKAFQLTFPDFSDQSFQITRNIVPSATSNLIFYDLFRFVTTASHLSAEISTDSGITWTEVWGRNGNGSTSSSGWDSAFNSRSVSLAAYAGIPIRVRFIFRSNNSAFLGTTSSTGIFLDDISVTNATQLINTTTTTLAGSAASFTLNSTTAGGALAVGTTYFMQIRPNVGTRWFGFGALKIVTAQTPSGYALWVANQYPQVTGGPAADQDGDGLANGIEYAFGLNPTVANGTNAIPKPTIVGGNYVVTFTQPGGVTGVAYIAQWSSDLANWNTITDTGSGATHTFSVSTAGKPRLFFHYVINVTP